MRECAEQETKSYHHIIKSSLMEYESESKECRRLNIISIHKTGSEEYPLNHRLVFLTGEIHKICEKLSQRDGLTSEINKICEKIIMKR